MSGQLSADSRWLAQTPVTRANFNFLFVLWRNWVRSASDADAIWHTSNRILHSKHLWHNQFAFETCGFSFNLIISVGKEVRDVGTSGIKAWRKTLQWIECINVATHRFVASRGIFARHFTHHVPARYGKRYFSVRLTCVKESWDSERLVISSKFG